jgi:CHAD domain-containing protein
MAAATRTTKKNRRLETKRARLLQTRAPMAVRRIARTFLAAARRARSRLYVRGDQEALHDFRVALRRLRSTLRVYRPVVGAGMVPRRWRRRLKRLARATGGARDAEVGLAWLRAQRDHATAAERAACDWLIGVWSARFDNAYEKVRRTLEKEFDPLDAGLRRAFTVPAPLAATSILAPTAGKLVHDQVTELATTLHRITSVAEWQTIHAARIEAKRLRYLLEPLAGEVAGSKTLVKSLKKFQDDFGELCDRQVLCEELIATAAAHAAEHSAQELRSIIEEGAVAPPGDGDMLQGLRELTGRLNTERKHYYERIEEHYLGQQADTFLAPYRALADTLTRPRAALKPRTRIAKVRSKKRASRQHRSNLARPR